MNQKEIKWRLRYFLQFVPFTFNSVWCALAIGVAYKLLYSPPSQEDTNAFRPFIILMGRFCLWFFISLVAFSLLSTIFSWLYFKWQLKKKGHKLQVEFTADNKINSNKLQFSLTASIEGVIRPVLGFVKGRLIYDDNQLTDKFSLLSNKRKEHSLRRLAITGRSNITLPDIKEYELRGGLVYFEDMLHLFSLAVPQQVSGQFYQPPYKVSTEDKNVAPKKTETTDIRIEQMRRVDGEMLNYKDFEAGDDVRRIVWKIYAKNKELVVRIPEMFEPYASHLYFYASFHAAIKEQWLNDSYMKEMLNYYKNRVWTIYDTLHKKEWQLRYIPDQPYNAPEHISEYGKDTRTIVNSSWQQDKPLLGYFNYKAGTVLCISSLADVDEVQQLLDNSNSGTVIYFFKLSKTFNNPLAWTWFQRLLFLPPKNRLQKLRASWVFSPLRAQMHKREKKIEELLKKSNVTSAVI
jgi:Protein of unknown function DUF58